MTSDPFDPGRPAPSADAGVPGSAPVGHEPPPSPAVGSSPAPGARHPPVARPIPSREPPSRRPRDVPLAPTAPRPPAGTMAPGPRRSDDRRIAAGAIGLAGTFLVAAVISALASAADVAVISPWLPIHLALAGGATTAIAGVMPFFVAALAAGPPAGARVRGTAVALVAAGAALVAVRGVAPSVAWAPVAGGVMYLAGIAAVALAVRASGPAGLMMRRPIVSLGYTLALVNVAIGALLGTLSVAGWLPVLEAWARLRPAHAWANLIGFVSLVIIATLLHFLPTVVGGRIVPRRSAVVAVLATAMGAPLVVAGLFVGWGPLAGAGAVLTVVGALALAVEAAHVVRDRGRWTSDPGWHRFASVGLLAGIGWYLAGTALAAALVLVHGASGEAWSTPLVGAPLAVGWFVQVLIAAWTHLLPSIGPGGPVRHARQRIVLGRLATARLLALNAGTVLLWLGWATGAPTAAAGAALAGATVLASAALAVAAIRAGADGS